VLFYHFSKRMSRQEKVKRVNTSTLRKHSIG